MKTEIALNDTVVAFGWYRAERMRDTAYCGQMISVATGLSSVLSDTSASRRFFMLDGVETKSPSGKIVVVKSGTKVRKMVVR